MYNSQRRSTGKTERQGSIAVLSAFLMIPMMAFAAFSVDLGYIATMKSQLQNAADSAAMAAVAALTNTDLDEADREANARLWAKAFAEMNQPSNGDILVDADITLGRWSTTTRTFSELAQGENPNSVRIVARRTKDGENEVPLFFGPVLGINNVDVTATAIAKTGEDDPRDVILVLDCSGSMIANNRMQFTKAAAYALAEELLDTDRLGLVVYSYRDGIKTTGFLEREMSFDHSPVLSRIPQLEPGMYTSMTNIAGGIRVALEEFDSNERSLSSNSVAKVLVLMTDGHANVAEAPSTSPTLSIDFFAQVAKSDDVVIHTVTLGSGADKVYVKNAAELTGGSYHHVEDGDYQGIIEAFRKIGRGDGVARIVQ